MEKYYKDSLSPLGVCLCVCVYFCPHNIYSLLNKGLLDYEYLIKISLPNNARTVSVVQRGGTLAFLS